jgi:hypothetical protein
MDAKHNRTIVEVAMGYKKPLDRSDRAILDYKKYVVLFLGKDTFFENIISVSNKLNLGPQSKKEDLQKPILQLGKYSYEINSKKVQLMNKKDRELFDKEIHKLLIKQKLNYNFYPLIQYILLYQDLPQRGVYIFPPNPKMFQLYTEKQPLEFVRNSHTTSDKKFFIYQAKIAHKIFGKPTKEDRKTLDFYEELISINKNKERVRDIKGFNDDFERIVHHYQSIDDDGKVKMHRVSETQIVDKDGTTGEYSTIEEGKRNEKRLWSLQRRLKNKGII